MNPMDACPTCDRPRLPEPSDVPPSPALHRWLEELRRFAAEFDGMDPSTWRAVDFIDWLELSVGAARRSDHRENRQAGQYERWRAA